MWYWPWWGPFHGGSHSEGPGVFQLTMGVKFMDGESSYRAVFLFQPHGKTESRLIRKAAKSFLPQMWTETIKPYNRIKQNQTGTKWHPVKQEKMDRASHRFWGFNCSDKSGGFVPPAVCIEHLLSTVLDSVDTVIRRGMLTACKPCINWTPLYGPQAKWYKPLEDKLCLTGFHALLCVQRNTFKKQLKKYI